MAIKGPPGPGSRKLPRMTRHTHASAALLLALSLVACGRTHDTTDDAGGPIPPTEDGGTPMADAARPDAGLCSDGIEWLDDPPIVRYRFGSVPPRMATDGDGFLVVSSVFIPDGCEAPCVHAERFPADGGESVLTEIPLAGEGRSDPFRLFATTTPGGDARYAIAWSDELRWGRGPDWSGEAGRVRFDGTLGSVAFDRADVLVETHDSVPVEGRRADAIYPRVTRHRGGDTPVEDLELDPSFGFEFWSPTLVVSPDGPWLAVIQDVDFPPAVQVAGPEGSGWVGSSCGVSTYDLLPESTTDVIVVGDCGEHVSVVRRRLGGRDWDVGAIEGREASSTVGSRLASDGEHIAVAYRGDDGFTHVTVLSAGLEEVASAPIPRSEHLMVPGDMALQATPDGTFAVLVTDAFEGYERTLINRFRVCAP